MKLFLPFVIFFFCTFFSALAQRTCPSAAYKKQLIASDPSFQNIFRAIENQVAAFDKSKSNTARRDTIANEIIYIPVVVHVLYKNSAENISDAQVKSQLDVLNNDFNKLNADKVNTPKPFSALAGDARIQFCLARVDADGKPTSGIDRKYTSQDQFIADDGMKMVNRGGVAAWDSKRYLNIWVCKLGSKSLGYATPPGAPADVDGVVIASDVFGTIGNLRESFNKGRTATHEVGHWLGLLHTWGDDNCGSDQVEDTPPQQSYNYGCPSFPVLSSCSIDGNGDMFMNFMDFSDDACMNLFTKGQVKRMRALFAKNNIRNSFLASTACDSTTQAGPLPGTISETEPAPVLLVTASVKIYPNPVHSVTTIESKAASANTQQAINIFNSLGMKVFSGKLIQEKTIVDLSNLAPGIYVVHIGDGKEKSITKIIKR